VTAIARRLHELPGTSYAPDEKVVALTFDDAPGPNTAPVLDTLAACATAATFFVVGQSVEREPGLMTRIVDEGHAVGNHSWTHTRLEELDNPTLLDEFSRTGALANEFTHAPVHLARPPFRMTQASRLAALLDPLGYTAVVGWSVDPRDWEGHDAMTITETVVQQLQPGAIVLLHVGHGDGRSTAAAVRHIVQAGRLLGYRFVTL
jgi:peptidoglycan/xylan/chitin deacetylase (PgdA/CDA1 family)